MENLPPSKNGLILNSDLSMISPKSNISNCFISPKDSVIMINLNQKIPFTKSTGNDIVENLERIVNNKFENEKENNKFVSKNNNSSVNESSSLMQEKSNGINLIRKN